MQHPLFDSKLELHQNTVLILSVILWKSSRSIAINHGDRDEHEFAENRLHLLLPRSPARWLPAGCNKDRRKRAVDGIGRASDEIIDWRRWEEIIAGAYKQQGFDVELTSRSNDKGRDVIATSRGLGSVRFVDQVKAYRPGHVVTAEEVRAMVGVLALQPNVSKGLVTTTSSFAPGIMKDPTLPASCQPGWS